MRDPCVVLGVVIFVVSMIFVVACCSEFGLMIYDGVLR